MAIKIFYDNTNWRLKAAKKVKGLINKVIVDENYIPGDLNFIFTDDRTMLKINREFLKHNYFTDVITFREEIERRINGEVYVGIETVKKNSDNYKVSYGQEVLRVLIHGALHLCGYDDMTEKERAKMTEMEDYWLNYFERRYNEL